MAFRWLLIWLSILKIVFSELHAGKIFIANCSTQAVESTEPYRHQPHLRYERAVATTNEKENPILSEEDQDDFSSGDDSESYIDYTPRDGTNDPVISVTFKLDLIFFSASYRKTTGKISEAKKY